MGKPRKTPKDQTSKDAIVNRLELLRLALGLHPAAFARRWGITAQLLHNYRRRKTNISLKAAYKLCAATGVHLDYIYRGSMTGVPPDLVVKIRTLETAETVKAAETAPPKRAKKQT